MLNWLLRKPNEKITEYIMSTEEPKQLEHLPCRKLIKVQFLRNHMVPQDPSRMNDSWAESQYWSLSMCSSKQTKIKIKQQKVKAENIVTLGKYWKINIFNLHLFILIPCFSMAKISFLLANCYAGILAVLHTCSNIHSFSCCAHQNLQYFN